MTHPPFITGDEAADRLLADDPFALLTGMLLDQQILMETAFAGPAKLDDRLGGLDPARVADMDAEEFAAVMAEKPAVHRYHGSMATRVQQLARAIVDDWGGDASAIWTRGEPDGAEVLERLRALPGFGDQKARIFLALLGKRRGFDGDGWREAAGEYGEEGAYRSVADVVDEASIQRVRETKQRIKAAAKAAKASRA